MRLLTSRCFARLFSKSPPALRFPLAFSPACGLLMGWRLREGEADAGTCTRDRGVGERKGEGKGEVMGGRLTEGREGREGRVGESIGGRLATS